MIYLSNLVIFIFGASIGSFLNVLIDRLPKEESINGRSHCDFCGKKINWFDMFPVFSYFVLKGRARCCGKKLSFQYPLIEMLAGISFVLIFNFLPPKVGFNEFSILQILQIIRYFGLTSCLIVIFVSDFKYHLISDNILFTLLIFSDPTLSSLYVSFPIFLIYLFSKERAMGLGDVYMTAIMGFLLGWQKGFLALYIAFVTGAIFGLIIILFRHRKLKSKIAFGPFLVIGTAVMLFWGEKILEMIRRAYGL